MRRDLENTFRRWLDGISEKVYKRIFEVINTETLFSFLLINTKLHAINGSVPGISIST